MILAVPAMFMVLVGLPRALVLRNTTKVRPANSSLYVAKQALAAFLAVAMLCEMWLAVIRNDYSFKVVSPACQFVGLVRCVDAGRKTSIPLS